jgi:hypothetical protein
MSAACSSRITRPRRPSLRAPPAISPNTHSQPGCAAPTTGDKKPALPGTQNRELSQGVFRHCGSHLARRRCHPTDTHHYKMVPDALAWLSLFAVVRGGRIQSSSVPYLPGRMPGWSLVRAPPMSDARETAVAGTVLYCRSMTRQECSAPGTGDTHSVIGMSNRGRRLALRQSMLQVDGTVVSPRITSMFSSLSLVEVLTL